MVAVKFSIIVPVYNVAQYLRECLDSIVAQGYRNWECICVDDGSTDDSGAILDEYAARDDRFVVVHQANAGVSAARNRGMDEASGDYILFVDGDDACVPWMLERISKATQVAPEADFIMFGAQHVADMSEPLPAQVQHPQETVRIDSDAHARMVYERVNGVLLAWGGCHKASSVRQIRFRPYPNGEDALFGYTCMCHAKQISFMPEQLYRYRLPRKGSANGMTLRNLKSCCEIGKEYRAVTAGWRYRHILESIPPRKAIQSRYGIKYKIVLNVPAGQRREAWQILQCDLKKTLDIKPSTLRARFAWDRLVARLAVGIGGRFAFHIFGYWPFRARVWLLKIPGVAFAKQLVRGGRMS